MAEVKFERPMSTYCIAFSKFLQPVNTVSSARDGIDDDERRDLRIKFL